MGLDSGGLAKKYVTLGEGLWNNLELWRTGQSVGRTEMDVTFLCKANWVPQGSGPALPHLPSVRTSVASELKPSLPGKLAQRPDHKLGGATTAADSSEARCRASHSVVYRPVSVFSEIENPADLKSRDNEHK